MVISVINSILIIAIIITLGVLYSKYKDKITDLFNKSDKASNTFDKVCTDGIDVNIPKGSLMNLKMGMGMPTLQVPQSDATIHVPVDCS